MSDAAAPEQMTSADRRAVLAATLAWAMDSFDYFVVVLVYLEVGQDFGVSPTRRAFLTTVTLLMRPFGAALFGIWADKVGRKKVLMIDVGFYSFVGFLCTFAPNYTTLLVLRLLYGIGMGGEWGLGASLSMEKVPPGKRGLVSGIVQQGYAIGYMLAAVAYLLIENLTTWGWRGLFAFPPCRRWFRCSSALASPSRRRGRKRGRTRYATRRRFAASCPRQRCFGAWCTWCC